MCRSCERWNLSPLEECWEAIEEAEKLYTDTRRRASTENVGLAKLRDGLTLVRIGSPQRPEFAAWRCGDQFGRRRTRALLVAGGGVTVLTAAIVGGAAAGVGMGSFGWGLAQVGRAIVYGRAETVVAKIRTEHDGIVQVRRRHLGESSLGRGRIASIIVPKLNRFGGNKAEVADAAEEIGSQGSSERFIDHLSGVSHVHTKAMPVSKKSKWRRGERQFHKYGLYSPAHSLPSGAGDGVA